MKYTPTALFQRQVGGVAERQPATNTALFQVTVVNQYIIVYPDILDKISRI